MLAALGLMIPWAAPLVITGLSVDMFGAIYTHVHNGDPLSDSSAAISQLVGFAILMTLWALQRRPAASPRSTRRRFAAISATAVLCMIAAVSGGAPVRRFSPALRALRPPAQSQPSAK